MAIVFYILAISYLSMENYLVSLQRVNRGYEDFFDDYSDSMDPANVNYSDFDVYATSKDVGRDVYLYAYKVENRPNEWVTLGYPSFRGTTVDSRDGGNSFIEIRLLSVYQIRDLKNAIKEKYPDVDGAEISLIPFQSIHCWASMIDGKNKFRLSTNKYSLVDATLTLRVSKCRSNTPIYRALSRRIDGKNDLQWHCTFKAGGKMVRKERLPVSYVLQDVAYNGGLFRGVDPIYVTRKQLRQLTINILARLHTEEDFSFDDDDDGMSSRAVFNTLLRHLAGPFRFVHFNESIRKLSPYDWDVSYNLNQSPFGPNQDSFLSLDYANERLSQVFQVKSINNKRIISILLESETSSEHDPLLLMGKKLERTVVDLFPSIKLVNRSGTRWLRQNFNLEEQLEELNSVSRGTIKWYINGFKVLPESLFVAPLSPHILDQEINVEQNSKCMVDFEYNKMAVILTKPFIPG